MLCLSTELHAKGLFQTSDLGLPMSVSGSSSKSAAPNVALGKVGLPTLENEFARENESWRSCCPDTERMGSPGGSSGSEGAAITSPYQLQLEHDVRSLQEKLHVEIQLHVALESVVGKTAASLSSLACLPDEAQELLNSIAALEVTVSNLEEELVSLHFQLSQERRLAEYCLKQSPSSHLVSCTDKICMPVIDSPAAVSPSGTSGSNCRNISDDLKEKGAPNHICFWQDIKPPKARYQRSKGVKKEISLKGLWHHPNQLSEEMVRCMKNIFICLADASTISSISSSTENLQFPTFLHDHLSANSLSSFSESSEQSTMSSMQSPMVELRCSGDILAEENVFDPYKVRGKLSWVDIGNYSSAVEVSWMSVGKHQLEYAAGALRRFRSLVEQLAKVNPANLCCDEKLAFWINVYNALIMHAYLAYGVPRSELKFFSLMQKAAYTVGGHSFSAAAIEYVILKMKPPVHRPQTALLLALHKLKTSEEQRRFSVDSPDPLVVFALSSGMYSSPAVRIYTACNVKEELQQSLRDYVRASVGVSRKGKLFLPKMLHCFAKAVPDGVSLVSWICQFLPTQQASMVEDCMSQRRLRVLGNRNYAVVPFDSRFRYLFLPEAAM